MKYEIIPLLEQKAGEDSASGPMSPVLFMNETGKALKEHYNRLARVHFSDGHIHNWNEGSRSNPEWTGCDTLILAQASRGNEIVYITMWVDEGTCGCPVGIWYPEDPDIIVTPIYKENTRYAVKLTAEEIKEIFESAIANHKLDITVK